MLRAQQRNKRFMVIFNLKMLSNDHLICLISVTYSIPLVFRVLSGTEFTTYVLASSAVGAFVHASRMASDFLKHVNEHA